MKLSEFIEKYGDRKVDEWELMETLHIKDKVWLPFWGLDPKNTADEIRVLKARLKELEAERQKFMRYMEREFAKNSDPIDWEDTNQRKWYILCDASSNVILDSYVAFQIQGTLFTTNKHWLRKFIEQNEDDIKRYCFGA